MIQSYRRPSTKGRFRTPKTATRLYIEAKFGKKEKGMNQPQKVTPEQSQAAIDELTKDVTVTPQQRLSYYLYDLSRELGRLANQAHETGVVEAAEMRPTLRRLAAALLAAEEIEEGRGEGILELLNYPHRVKGTVIP